MTKKIILGTIIAAVFVLGSLAVIGLSSNSAKNDNELSNQGLVVQNAYAVSPNHMIIEAEFDPDFGSGSGFIVDNIECKIFTKNGANRVEECKATAFIDRGDPIWATTEPVVVGAIESLESEIQPLVDEPSPEELLYNCLIADLANHDKCIVEYEVSQLIIAMGGYLEGEGYEIPQDYKTKYVQLEWSIQNNDGIETGATKAVVGIEY